MPTSNILVYFVRKDLRVSDNPILHHLASSDHGFTHLLPVFVFPAHQVEISGFIKDEEKSPYPQALSHVAKYWRCGPHRAKFIGEAVWNLKELLESLGVGLAIRAGTHGDIAKQLLHELHEKEHKIGAVWMTSEEGVEEKQDENAVSTACQARGVEFKLWQDEKYFIDDRDLSIKNKGDLPDIFTTYRKTTEPLRDKPRKAFPKPAKSSLPPFLESKDIPSQSPPFSIPDSYKELEIALLTPVKNFIPDILAFPENATSAHPFQGGEEPALQRLHSLLESEAMINYKETRNGLLGTEFSTKLSAFLAQGCLTARQIHEAMAGYEDGTNQAFEKVKGYGQGENEGTMAVRFELLWRDYMRLCTRKFEKKLFHLEGFRGGDQYKGDKKPKWKSANPETALPEQDPSPEVITKILERFKAGTTGMGLIDASQRELIHSGYTSNRARQNVASFLAKHLGIDWRYGAEWYEMLLVDYDVSSNWANWQYVAGVGNDPRGEARIFNPVKQAFDYDKEGTYVRTWVPEVRKLEKLENVFQAWTTAEEELEQAGLTDNPMVTDPIKKIDFSVEGKPKNSKRPFIRRRGNGRRGGGNYLDRAAEATSTGVQTDGHTPTGPSHYRNNSQNHYQDGEAHRGGYRGRSGGGYRGRGYNNGRGGYRGRYFGPPRHSWIPAPNAGV